MIGFHKRRATNGFSITATTPANSIQEVTSPSPRKIGEVFNQVVIRWSEGAERFKNGALPHWKPEITVISRIRDATVRGNEERLFKESAGSLPETGAAGTASFAERLTRSNLFQARHSGLQSALYKLVLYGLHLAPERDGAFGRLALVVLHVPVQSARRFSEPRIQPCSEENNA
jgi:hypothetical protein